MSFRRKRNCGESVIACYSSKTRGFLTEVDRRLEQRIDPSAPILPRAKRAHSQEEMEHAQPWLARRSSKWWRRWRFDVRLLSVNRVQRLRKGSMWRCAFGDLLGLILLRLYGVLSGFSLITSRSLGVLGIPWASLL